MAEGSDGSSEGNFSVSSLYDRSTIVLRFDLPAPGTARLALDEAVVRR
jgi:hypothetical protein